MHKKTHWILIVAVLTAGLFFRIWNIGFGLPHSFYADEPEIAELAIKYTYELKNIVSDNNYYKLIPVSYVYGTFPAYFLTLTTMVFSKTANTFRLVFDKTDLYISMRIIMAAMSLIVAVSSAVLYKKLFKNSTGVFLVLGLLALNWKFIVLAHYVNQDIFLALLLNLSFLAFYLASQKNFDNRNTVLSGILFGLAVGTKFTALISLPLFLFILLAKKDLKATLGFCLTALLTFMATNPFSIIFFKDFSFRIIEMFFKEGGLVFDSVDSNPFKYISALIFMLGIPVVMASVLGIWKTLKATENRNFHIFLAGNILIYILFFSLQSRRVDRWLLPVLPLLIIYAVNGINLLRERMSKKIFITLFSLFFLTYVYYPSLLLVQFKKDTPKSATYKWVKENIPLRTDTLPYILVYTEEGLDPLNKVGQAKVFQVNVYESENAALFYPQDPSTYEYVIISSRPMSNYKRPEVIKAYPLLTNRWKSFENELQNSGGFELIKEFTLPKPNLVPLSDVYIYRNPGFKNQMLVKGNL
jgi:4-amino-4-deoxy-L-arabinose transferase-like glycosyltransferase